MIGYLTFRRESVDQHGEQFGQNVAALPGGKFGLLSDHFDIVLTQCLGDLVRRDTLILSSADPGSDQVTQARVLELPHYSLNAACTLQQIKGRVDQNIRLPLPLDWGIIFGILRQHRIESIGQ